MSSLASRNLRLLLILDCFNPLYPLPPATSAGPNDPTSPYSTKTVPAFAAMAKAAAAHFAGKGVVFEIWNEENGGFWPQAPATSTPGGASLLCPGGASAPRERLLVLVVREQVAEARPADRI